MCPQASGALSEGVLKDIVHPVGAVRKAGAVALAALATENEDLVTPVTLELIEIFKAKKEVCKIIIIIFFTVFVLVWFWR